VKIWTIEYHFQCSWWFSLSSEAVLPEKTILAWSPRTCGHGRLLIRESNNKEPNATSKACINEALRPEICRIILRGYQAWHVKIHLLFRAPRQRCCYSVFGAPLKAIASLIDDPDHVVLTPQCHLFQTLLLGVHFLGEVELVWKLDLAGIFLMTAINS
jgi:hypothetical protein